MTLLFESPVAIAVLGVLTLAILLGGWYQTQQRGLLIAAVATFVLFVGLLVLERSIITDAEAVKATIRTIGREAEAGDVEALAARFHSTAEQHRNKLRTEFALYDIEKVSIKNNLKVTVDRKHQPPQAIATFNVVVTGGDRAGVVKERSVPRFIEARFWLEDGEWRCVDYKHDDFQAGMQQRALGTEY